jgi:predicted metalloprotease with PDZ domain
LLKERPASRPVELTLFRYERLRRVRVLPQDDKRFVARLATVAKASKPATAVRKAWLGSAEAVSTARS